MNPFTVTAENELDAVDQAKRDAKAAGLRVVGEGRRYRGAIPGQWVVWLRVEIAR